MKDYNLFSIHLSFYLSFSYLEIKVARTYLSVYNAHARHPGAVVYQKISNIKSNPN